MEWPYLYIVKALELTVLLLLLRYKILLQGFAGGGGGGAGPRDFPVYVVSYFSTKSGNSFATFSFRHLW